MDQRNRSGDNVGGSKIDHQANLGDRGTYYENQTNNFFTNDDSSDLIRRIDDWLIQAASLPPDVLVKLQNWRETLLSLDGATQLKKIRHEFVNEEAKLKGVARDLNNQLKIWLNRSPQRKTFLDRLKKFCKPKEICPLIFCITGRATEDVIEDASEMLQCYYFNEVMRNDSAEINKQKRINESVYLQNASEAQAELENILRDLLDSSIDKDYEELLAVLNEQFKTHRIVTRCKVREWKPEGLKAFFKQWHADIIRENRFPFLLFLEFNEEDHEALSKILDQDFCEAPAVLLPALGMVEAHDVIDFFARVLMLDQRERSYREIFDDNSLKTQDTPLPYRDAKNKLQLKYH